MNPSDPGRAATSGLGKAALFYFTFCRGRPVPRQHGRFGRRAIFGWLGPRWGRQMPDVVGPISCVEALEGPVLGQT